MKRLIATLLLPLSIVPVALAVPHVADQHAGFEARYLERGALAAPRVAGVPRVPTIPAHPDRVPVLVYHGINGDGARESVTREAFARQMAALDRAGYEAIGADTYARLARGEDVDLPARPVLITFDDGRLDSFRGADAVLERHGFEATMFAITGVTVEHSDVYLGPEELREMTASGRWDVQLHAADGHRQIRSASGERRPFYAARAPGETLPEFTRRVAEDLDEGLARLPELVPDAGTELFAVPYSDYGQTPGAEPGVRRALVGELRRRFDAVFVQRDDAPFARPGQTGLVARYEPRNDTTAEDVLGWLRGNARAASTKGA